MSTYEYQWKKSLKSQIHQIEEREKEVKSNYKECKNEADNPFITIGMRGSWYQRAMSYQKELELLGTKKSEILKQLAN